MMKEWIVWRDVAVHISDVNSPPLQPAQEPGCRRNTTWKILGSESFTRWFVGCAARGHKKA